MCEALIGHRRHAFSYLFQNRVVSGTLVAMVSFTQFICFTLRAPDGMRTSVLATMVFLGSVWLIYDWHRATSLVWLIYLFKRPPPVLWDHIHSRANGSSGIWRYGSSVHPELLCYIESHHPEYDSLLDVASNLGIMLGRLKDAHPNAIHVGTDISSEMVSSTRRRCPSCSTHQFDLQRLLDVLDDASFKPGRAGVPEAADLVLVSDVLYYMAWGGWPPVLLQMPGLVPPSSLRASQALFFRRLRSLARVEVIFSAHQYNPVVLGAFASNGIQLRHGVYSAAGTARPHLMHPQATQDRSGRRVSKAWWLRPVAEQHAMKQKFQSCLNSTGSRVPE